MFEELGYSKDYYVNGKYIGSLKSEKDRETMGYLGRKIEITANKITLQNKKSIKSGIETITELHIICGKLLKTIHPRKEDRTT